MAESFEHARALILENVSVLPVEAVPLLDVVGRVLAEDVKAPCDLPRWDNSAMDGFAVRAEDCGTLRPLLIDGYIPAERDQVEAGEEVDVHLIAAVNVSDVDT